MLPNSGLKNLTSERRVSKYMYSTCLIRRSTGFIMEGLPYHGDDLRYLCSKGLYPDAAVVLEVLYMYYK